MLLLLLLLLELLFAVLFQLFNAVPLAPAIKPSSAVIIDTIDKSRRCMLSIRSFKCFELDVASLTQADAKNAFKVADTPHPSWLLTLLPTDPPTPSLAIGTTTDLPPTPSSFTENPRFVKVLNQVLSECAHRDSDLINQARAFAATGRGFIHLSDERNPPDFGRVPSPEDIFGSIEVDGAGNIIGALQPSGTYRIVTNHGM